MMNIISAHSPQSTADGGITLMVTFEGLGEVPFHATPTDTEAHGRELFTRAQAGEFGAVAPYVAPVPTPEEQRRALEFAIQHHLDAQAQAHGYDSILSACSYAGSPNPFQAEGAAYLAWRAACWQHGYAVLAEVQAGSRPVPTADALVAELPALVLP